MVPLRNRILSRPCEVVWAGFRSTTYHLQQAGWDIAAEETPMYGRARLLLRHRDMKLMAVSEHAEYDYWRAHHEYMPTPTFHVVRVAPNFQIISLHGDNFAGFRQIDAAPQFVSRESQSIEDMGIFATTLVRTEEIIIEPADVSSMLEQIRLMQVPEQDAIRMRNRQREAREAGSFDGVENRPRQAFHAQIISLEMKAA